MFWSIILRASYGNQATSDAKRHAQAIRVRAIHDELITGGTEHIAVIGDFNDTPNSNALKPLLDGGPQDVFTHPSFDAAGYPGTYGLCNADNKIDCILLSPKLYALVE